MKTVTHQANWSDSTHLFAWTMAVLLPLSWAVPALGKSQANPLDSSAVAAGNQVAAAPAAGPEVWLCAGERMADLLRPEAQWPFVKQHLAGIKLYVDQINQAEPDQLAALVQLVQENRYQVAVELGGCLDFAPMDDTAGEWSARHELAKINKFYAAGGKVDFLDLDGPIRRLMYPENRRDGRRFDSIEKAADELVDALRLHTEAHPKTRFWLLSNFPNWGWRGDVSYHARGPQRQDYGDDDAAVRVVLRKLGATGIPLAGITVDNPYDYLVGEHRSVNLRDPKSVDWLKRVRSYEDFAREQGLEFNLIVNSERGGHESDERFCRETLQMVDLYRKAGGRPTRWFVQSWYSHPEQIVPETSPHSMTALVKAVIEQVGPGAATQSRLEAPADTQVVRVIDSVAYGKDAPEAQVLSAHLVPSPPPSPVLVQIISGGWNSSPSPDELEHVLAEAPIAFVPLGTFEHHGWHLPVCFDGIKAHALCERVAQRTGGAVLPTLFYGTGGGHIGYKWTLMLPETQITPLIQATLDHLARQGFKVVVLLTGHYPKEQVDMVHRLAQEAQERHPRVRFIGLTEPEVTTPQPADTYGGDHAAKYETSIAMALHPEWVQLERLTAGRDPTQVALPDTPRRDAPTHDPTHPLYAIYGQDPRTKASRELGEKLVSEIVSRLTGRVEEALHRVSSPTKP
jgi:creatinine amidohydrolase